jgi:flagellar motor protein MotB
VPPAQRGRSTLHLQLGQETIYLILAIAVFAAIMMASVIKKDREVEKDPPIITMNEANGYYFPTASAEITPQFRAKLVDEIVPLVASIGERADAEVVEVIGHTDEVPISRRLRGNANLDETLMAELSGNSKLDEPSQAADNAGLGMARAVAVARVLKASPALSRFQIFPISAGAFQRTDDTMATGADANDDQERRRIVIRMRRRVQEEVQAGAN